MIICGPIALRRCGFDSVMRLDAARARPILMRSYARVMRSPGARGSRAFRSTVAGLAAHVAHHARRHLDELAVRLRHLAAGQVEVVLETHAHVAAEHERRGQHPPLAVADADDLPLAPRRQSDAIFFWSCRLSTVGGIPPSTLTMNEN